MKAPKPSTITMAVTDAVALVVWLVPGFPTGIAHDILLAAAGLVTTLWTHNRSASEAATVMTTAAADLVKPSPTQAPFTPPGVA